MIEDVKNSLVSYEWGIHIYVQIVERGLNGERKGGGNVLITS